MLALQAAGGAPRIVHTSAVVAGEVKLDDFAMLVLPGGFSYGDDLGAGRLWATDLREGLGDALEAFVARGRPVLGICNGFQALVKAGLLPGDEADDTVQRVTLTRNDSARFTCRWVWLEADPESPCVFTRDLDGGLIHCPVAHGEGKLVARDDEVRAAIGAGHLGPLRYVPAAAMLGAPLRLGDRDDRDDYNPNGSEGDLAALCNPAGNVLGLMPHPEDHIVPTQHPGYHRGARGHLGLALFEAGIRYAAQVG